MADLAAWSHSLWLGFVVTIQLAAVTAVLTYSIAGVLAILAIAPTAFPRRVSRVYVEVFRSIPILALLIFLYYGLGPVASHLGISGFWIAAVALSVIEAAYAAELLRAALGSVTVNQWEAGQSLGLTWWSTLRLVVLPQATLAAVPGVTNMLVAVIKDTSLASLIAVNEISLAATNLIGVTFQPIPTFALVGLFYLGLILPLSLLAFRVERVVAKATGLTLATPTGSGNRSLVDRIGLGAGRRWR